MGRQIHRHQPPRKRHDIRASIDRCICTPRSQRKYMMRSQRSIRGACQIIINIGLLFAAVNRAGCFRPSATVRDRSGRTGDSSPLFLPGERCQFGCLVRAWVMLTAFSGGRNERILPTFLSSMRVNICTTVSSSIFVITGAAFSGFMLE